MLGVFNSQLIRYYVGLDANINIMMVLLNYWPIVHNIAGQKMTKYSLYLMVELIVTKIFFIPPVFSLQRACWLSKRHEFWNGGFKAVNLYKSTTEVIRDTTLKNMLKGFTNAIRSLIILKPIVFEL